MDAPTLIEVPSAVSDVADRLLQAGHDAVLVGGAVRDALLGERSFDWDLATGAGPSDVRALVSGLAGIRGVYDLGERFGTIGISLDGGERLEVTRWRPGAAQGATLEQRFALDAGSRDFTVNAMGFDLATGTLLDPLGGRSDLGAGVLRAPGSPDERLAEDPIRVLRAARFAAELGAELEPATRAALPAHAPHLERVAVERVRDELTKLLVAPHAEQGLALLRDSEALAVVLPELAALDGVTQPTFHDLDVLAHTIQAVSLAPATPVLRWAVLLHDVGKAPVRSIDGQGRIRFFRHARTGAALTEAICKRLKMSSNETASIVHLVAEHMRWGDVNLDNPRSVDRAVRKLDLWVGAGDGARRIVSAEDAVALTIADYGATAHRETAPRLEMALCAAVARSRQRGTREVVTSPLTGRELMSALGLAEGPYVGVAKRAIERAIERGSLEPDDRAGALEVAREAIARST